MAIDFHKNVSLKLLVESGKGIPHLEYENQQSGKRNLHLSRPLFLLHRELKYGLFSENVGLC